MISLYRLPISILSTLAISSLLIMILLLTSFILQLFVNNSKIKALYYLSLSFIAFVLMMTYTLSVQYFITNAIIDINIILRYSIIIPIIIMTIISILEKKYFLIIDSFISLLILPLFNNIFNNFIEYIYIIVTLYFMAIAIFSAVHFIIKSRKDISVLSIKQSLDTLPIGIAFFNGESMTFINTFMEELFNKANININNVISNIINDIFNIGKKLEENILIEIENKKYLISKKEIMNKTELLASDVTDIINLNNELIEKKNTLKENNEKIKNTIDNIQTIEKEKAILKYKSKIHDILAQKLTIINQFLNQKNDDVSTISNLINEIESEIKNEDTISIEYSEDRLIENFKYIGYTININNSLPTDLKKKALLLKIIRECATNSIRHGGATELYVDISYNEKITCIITNNGISPNEITDGNGLKGLKFSVLEAGGIIDITTPPIKFKIEL